MNSWAHGVFESLREYRGQFFLGEEHLDRLFESAQSLGWQVPFSREVILERMQEECQRSEQESHFVRITLYREWDQEKYHLSVVAMPSKQYPRQYYEDGVSLVTVPTRRNRVNTLSPQIKSNNTLPGVMAIEEAHLNGAFEALQVNSFGYVTEGTISNLFIAREGILLTPPAYVGILKGVTRDLVIRLAKESLIQVQEVPFTRHEVYNAGECFLTNTSMGIMPVREVDERAIGQRCPGTLTEYLMKQLNLFLTQWEAKVDQDSHSALKRI